MPPGEIARQSIVSSQPSWAEVMHKSPKILIADRNRHVRDLLRREFTAAGYQVQLAKDAHEVLTLINGTPPPHLLILDSELPFLAELAVLKRLRERYPRIPVVIHYFAALEDGGLRDEKGIVFVEKKGDTERLKAVVNEVIGRISPGVSI